MSKRVLILLLLSAVILMSAQPIWSQQRVDADSVADEAIFGKIVNLEMNQVRLYKALEELFKGADLTYYVAPEIRDVRVTAVLKNVSVKDAFQQILGAAGAVAEKENGAMHIMARQPSSNTLVAELERKIADLVAELGKERVDKTEDHPAVKSLEKALEELEKRLSEERTMMPQMSDLLGVRMAVPGAPGKGGKTQVFVIKYINPAELVPTIYAVGARQVTVTGDSRVVVSGTEEVLQKVGEVIADVDREESLPRPVRLKLTVNVRSEQKGGEPFDCSLSCDGAGAEGQPVSPNLSVKLPVGKTGDTANVLLTSTITPTITPDGKIALTGSGSFQCTPSGDISRTFEVAVVVQPGKPQAISEGSADVGTGKVSFSVEVVATIGEGRIKTKSKGGFNVPGIGNFGGYGGAALDLNGAMDAAATQWGNAFDAYGARMNGFAAAMDAAAARWQRAFEGVGVGGGVGGDSGGYGGYGQDSDMPDCSSGTGGGA